MIVVTGGSGFIGSHLIKQLSKNSKEVISLSSRFSNSISDDVKQISLGKFDGYTDFSKFLENVDTVIHLAGLTNSSDKNQNHLNNYIVTERLVKCAAEAGVKRFIFISTIGVCGNNSSTAFTEQSKLDPADHYSQSKLLAEEALKGICDVSDMEYVIIRPPLVYGKGLQGNLKNVVKLLSSKLPMPFRGVKSYRSLCSVKNLANLIEVCVSHPKALGKTFHVCDGHDIATYELFKLLSIYSGSKNIFFYVPDFILYLLEIISVRKLQVSKILNYVRVDCSYAQKELGWRPLENTKDGIRSMFT